MVLLLKGSGSAPDLIAAAISARTRDSPVGEVQMYTRMEVREDVIVS